MTLLDALILKKPQDYPSKEAYKQDLLKAVQILVRMGVMDNQSTEMKSAVDTVIQKLQEDELVIYGRKRSKEEILADLKAVNQELSEVNLEIAALEREIAIKKAKLAFKK